MNSDERVRLAIAEAKRMKHPNFPPEYAPKPKTKGTGRNAASNFLNATCVEYIKAKGGWATRVNTQGYKINLAKPGMVKNEKYVPGTTEVGTGDCVGCLNGKFFMLETKTKNDRMSEDQKRMQVQIESVGGFYFIIKNETDLFNAAIILSNS